MSHSFRQEPELTYEQAKQALHRALELQAEHESFPEAPEGVSGDQLAQMAAELGVKPEYLRQATNELRGIASKPAAWHVAKFGFDHWVERPLQEEDWVAIGPRIQPLLESLGSWDEDKQMARWVGPYQLKLTLTAVNDRTRARMIIDPGLEAGLGCGLGLFTLFYLFVIGGSISDHDIASITVVGAFYLIYVAVAGWFKLRANRQRRRIMRELSQVLAEYFAESGGDEAS